MKTRSKFSQESTLLILIMGYTESDINCGYGFGVAAWVGSVDLGSKFE